MSIQRVRSKWLKTKVLLKSQYIRQYIPKTKQFSRSVLQSMIEEYDMIYVKPAVGAFGHGVIRVEKTNVPSAGYRYQLNKKAHFVSTIDQLYEGLKSLMHHKKYIVQKGIYLLKHKSRRFDIRVMVQKNLKHKWETTGIIGRLAHPQKIVTNYSSGGSMMSIERLMSGHASPSEIAAYKNRLRRLGVTIAQQLQTAYPNLKEIGVDVAIDASLHPWVLEVNTKPQPYVFRMLSDKNIYKKIRRYSIAYGGMKAK